MVRTIFLLRYLSGVELRHTIQAATNKSEGFSSESFSSVLLGLASAGAGDAAPADTKATAEIWSLAKP